MTTPASGTLTWRVRIMFAVGQIPEGVQSTSFGIFLLFFYNQVLGLSGFLTSLALILALLVDAISDPVIGSWSDSIHNRWGRRHPFMYAAAMPFAVCFYLLFSPPAGLDETEVKLESNYIEAQEKERTLLKDMNEKYGQGTLNPQTGEFTSKLEEKPEEK